MQYWYQICTFGTIHMRRVVRGNEEKMGLFSRRRRKREREQEEIQSSTVSEADVKVKRPAKLDNQTDQMGYIKENCELCAESERQIAEAKVEYKAVTSYLTDMQRIDMIPVENRLSLEDAARQIINLGKERSKFQQQDSKLTDRHYHLFEQYEYQIPKELPVIKNSEQYQAAIEKDMEHLDKERHDLDGEQQDIINKQSFLRGIAITVGIIVIVLFIIFVILSSGYDMNMTLPFLLTVLMGMAAALYLFMEARRNSHDIQVVQMKLNREVLLMNKVKIKSVNNRSYLEYSYSKYMVDDYEQLKVLWEEYVRVKDETRRYQSNTQLLEFYNNELVDALKKFGIADAEIWIYQPVAILDKKEMVEVRHRLNVRRQKLRERIDLNARQKEEALASIDKMIRAYPECGEEAQRMMKRYQLNTEA